MTRFAARTHIAAPPQRVFDLSLRIETHTAAMAASGEHAVGGVTSGQLSLGDTVTWEARHFGLTWRLTSVISAFDRPVSFTDEQVSGPFRRWHHVHRFEPDGQGGTVMHDIVEFAAPLGPLGRIAEFAVLNRYLPGLIRMRNEHIGEAARSC